MIVDNLMIAFKDLDIGDFFAYDGTIWMKTIERAKPDGKPLNAFDMRPASPNFTHIDDDALVKIFRPKLRTKKY